LYAEICLGSRIDQILRRKPECGQWCALLMRFSKLGHAINSHQKWNTWLPGHHTAILWPNQVSRFVIICYKYIFPEFYAFLHGLHWVIP
jgi:hypothetical protein